MQEDGRPSHDLELFNLLEQYAPLVTKESAEELSVILPRDIMEEYPELAGMLRCMASLEGLSKSGEAGVSTKSAGSSFRTPRQIGPYLLEEELGRGGMGIVFRARHTTLRVCFAVKMIRSSDWASTDEVHRFYREARAAARLQHPNIVRVYDVGEQEGLHYLVMEHVTGGTLTDLIQSKLPASEVAASLMCPVVRAVEYLHSQGILHRDLKPSNVLLDEDGQPHVTDFGLAKVFDQDEAGTVTGIVIGTPAYMAPEQAWGHSTDITQQSDVYSLGAILYELLTGRPPFGESGTLHQLLSLRDAEPLPPRGVRPDIPKALEVICLKCLEKKPANRYASAGDLADDLQRFLNNEPIELPQVSWPVRIVRWARREPPLVTRLVGFLLTGLIVLYAELIADHPRSPFIPVMIVLGLWGLGSFTLQKLLNAEWQPRLVRMLWVGLDCLLFTSAVAFAEGPVESLIIGYGLLIAASAWWYDVQLVWLMTLGSMIAYSVLHNLRGETSIPGHYPLIVMGELAVVGGIVASLVHQIRDLLRRLTMTQK